MTLIGDEPAQPLTRGLSGIFRKKSKGGAYEGQHLDALHTFDGAAPAGQPLHHSFLSAGAAPPKGGWGILSRKASGGEQAAAQQQAAYLQQAQAYAQQQAAEMQAALEEQAEEVAGLRAALAEARASGREARERLNLQRFKYELLVDLWAMRVLDNEEMGAQAMQHAASPTRL